MRGRGSRLSGKRLGAALLLLGAVLLVRVPLDSQLAADFPHMTPQALAHFLADFSNYPKLYTDIDSWLIEDESGNYTSWHYTVSYACGARCQGRAAVLHEAHAAGAPRHSPAPRHRLSVLDTRCSHPPLLPWMLFCEEDDVETMVVQRAEGGARLLESARASCGLVRALLSCCDLAPRRRQHLNALRIILS